jgi:hypothetical protein
VLYSVDYFLSYLGWLVVLIQGVLKKSFSIYLELNERCSRCRRRSGCFDIFESVVESQGSERVKHGRVGHDGTVVTRMAIGLGDGAGMVVVNCCCVFILVLRTCA